MKFIPRLFFTLLLLCSFCTSCKKENTTIPYVAVNINVYVTDPQYVALNSIGGWIYITGGYRGIVIYRKTQTEFVAYERTCTYNPDDASEYVKVDNNNIELVDDHCGSRFIITDGNVTKGPATIPLKTYQTHFDGTVLNIYN